MATQPRYLKEIVFTIVCFIWMLFVATNVNQVLGQTYLHFTLGSLVLLIIGIVIFNKKLSITYSNGTNGLFKAIMWGIGGYIILLISSVLVLRFVDPANANVGSIIGLMGATTPALATSKIANFITFGIAIAFIETQLWGRMLEFFGDLFKIDINKKSLKTFGLIFLIAILAFGFMLFHLTSKGLTNTASLVVVFLMMVVSLVMITVFQETKQAVFMHIFANSVASYLLLFSVLQI